jgi:hypothetical protein
MTPSVELLTADMTISDGYDKIDKRIERILLEAVHVLDESVTIRAGHNGEMSVDHAQRQMVHVLFIN